MRDNRQTKDCDNIKKVAEWLEPVSQFRSDSGLCNILTDVTADVHDLHFISNNISAKTIGKPGLKISAKRSVLKFSRKRKIIKLKP